MKEQISNIINTYQNLNHFFGGVSNDCIQKAESALNLTFPESYRWFLNQYGSGRFEGLEIYGCENRAENSSVVNYTTKYREKYALPLKYVVLNDIDGAVYCLDTEKMNNRECPVVLWSRFTKERIKICYDSFNKYLLDNLQEVIDNFDEED